MTDGKPLSSLVSKKYSVSCPPLPPLAPECDDNPWSAAMKFHSSSQPVITTFSCSKDQAPTYILVWQNLRSVVQKWHFCLWHDLPWCVIRPCEISVVRSVKGKKKKMFLDEKLLAVVMLLAYHYIQLADHTVRLDDPVDRLGALEQQDDVTMQEGIILQRPQLHDDIHLESTAGKKEFWMVRSVLYYHALCVWPTN